MILFILCDAFFGLIYKKVLLKNFPALLFFKSTFIDKDDSNSAVTFPSIALHPEGENYWGVGGAMSPWPPSSGITAINASQFLSRKYGFNHQEKFSHCKRMIRFN